MLADKEGHERIGVAERQGEEEADAASRRGCGRWSHLSEVWRWMRDDEEDGVVLKRGGHGRGAESPSAVSRVAA